MNNPELIFDICYLLIVCGGLGALGNWLSRHSKNKHFADGLIHAQMIASSLVAKYAMDPIIAKGQIKDAVTHDLQVILDKHGYHFSAEYLVAVAVKELQHYENNGGKFRAEPTPPPANALSHVNTQLQNSKSSNNVVESNQNKSSVDDTTNRELEDLKAKGVIK